MPTIVANTYVVYVLLINNYIFTFQVNCDQKMHAYWDFDMSNALPRRVGLHAH